ncbi:hypothetical protein C8Q75DRAFT_346188 [Abortiporus biennis]|nr:hypothetical protein C8Q75DRAFT_346188 [Abortiporus biennis]
MSDQVESGLVKYSQMSSSISHYSTSHQAAPEPRAEEEEEKQESLKERRQRQLREEGERMKRRVERYGPPLEELPDEFEPRLNPKARVMWYGLGTTLSAIVDYAKEEGFYEESSPRANRNALYDTVDRFRNKCGWRKLKLIAPVSLEFNCLIAFWSNYSSECLNVKDEKAILRILRKALKIDPAQKPMWFRPVTC